MGKLVENIFGMASKPGLKLMRMHYWHPKLININPFPVPFDLPDDTKELALLAIKRITSVDTHTEVKEYDCNELEESIDKTWIISGNRHT